MRRKKGRHYTQKCCGKTRAATANIHKQPSTSKILLPVNQIEKQDLASERKRKTCICWCNSNFRVASALHVHAGLQTRVSSMPNKSSVDEIFLDKIGIWGWTSSTCGSLPLAFQKSARRDKCSTQVLRCPKYIHSPLTFAAFAARDRMG